MSVQWPSLVALVVLTAVVGLVWRGRQGRLRRHDGAAAGDASAVWAADLAALGALPGARATFLQFSAPVCAPCRATARVLGVLSAGEPGVAHVEVDVETHLDLALRAGVLRTPTVLVLDAAGAEVARASGAMTPAQARAALAAVTPIDQPSGRNA
ncbi:thioredoxin family protein [Isoptericola sp. S6320L]|uniref:thioredoxin family protein n=1 Tax=Isoptericola sp. S6320L TaxID=2926411 RepID=UPI001FF56DE3|nr:thioredoxin family protein [Isoptericola sp. S6320L]MCK0117033.1 thioredoxin family protein [Isoptericola sp. S6320L]